MAGSTSSAGARGGAITVLGQVVKLVVQLVALIALSRLLAPEDFGLLAMTTVFISLGSLVRDFGMSVAALQARSLSQQQASNLFWINTCLGLLAAGVLTATTPLLVAIYNEPRLTMLVPALSIAIVISGISAQAQVQLARSFKFKSLAAADVGSQALGVLAAVVAALLGWGYWALALQTVLTALTLMLIQFLSARWLPSWPKADTTTGPIVKSGANFGAAQLLTYAAYNVDNLAIGANWGAESLGLYNRAFQLLSLPVQALLSPLTNVVVPIVNRAQDEGKSVDDMLLRIQFAVGLAIVWAFAVASASADYLLPLLLGPGWEASIPLFQILAVGGAVQVFSFVSYWAFMLHGLSGELLKYDLVTKTISVVGIAASSFIGVEAVAWAYTLSLILSWPVNLIWLWKTAGQRSLQYLFNGLKILGAGLIGWLVAYLGLQVLPTDLQPFVAVLGAVFLTSLGFGISIIAMPGGYAQVKSATRLARHILWRKDRP